MWFSGAGSGANPAAGMSRSLRGLLKSTLFSVSFLLGWPLTAEKPVSSRIQSLI